MSFLERYILPLVLSFLPTLLNMERDAVEKFCANHGYAGQLLLVVYDAGVAFVNGSQIPAPDAPHAPNPQGPGKSP